MPRKLDKARLKSQSRSHGCIEIRLNTADGEYKGSVDMKKWVAFLKSEAPYFVPVESTPIPKPITYDTTVKKLFASEIYDSSGFPTIEVFLVTDRDVYRTAVPSDVMLGSGVHRVPVKDAHKSVKQAIYNIENIIGPQLVKSGLKVVAQFDVDDFLRRLDGSTDRDGAKSTENLGANALLAVSMAVCKAGADYKHMKLYQHIAELSATSQMWIPAPIFTLISSDPKSAENKLAVEEFLVSPVGASTYCEAMEIGTEIFIELKSLLEAMYKCSVTYTHDGSFALDKIEQSLDALRVIKKAIQRTGNAGKVIVGLKMAADEFYRKAAGKYDLEFKPEGGSDSSEWITGGDLAKLYTGLEKDYEVHYIEDAFGCDDWGSWTNFNANGSSSMQLVGGALTCGGHAQLETAMKKGAGNSVLLKLDQFATVTDFISRAKMARKGGWSVVVGTTLGETMDPFTGNLSIGLANGQIKAGAPCRERIATYNGLMRIERDSMGEVSYVGRKYRRPCDLN